MVVDSTVIRFTLVTEFGRFPLYNLTVSMLSIFGFNIFLNLTIVPPWIGAHVMNC